MRNKILLSTLLLSLFGGLTIATVSCDKKENDESHEVVTNVTKSLFVDTTNMKTHYFAGDLFDTTGLKVKVVTTKDGVADAGVLTADYKLSIEEGTALEAGEKTINVTSTNDNVAGTSFKVTVTNQNTFKYLVVDTTSIAKKNYYIGDTLNTEGLKVKLVTVTDGVADEGVEYKDYKLSIAADKKLDSSDKEVVVIPKEDDIFSDQFAIRVTPKPSLAKLKDIISYMKETNNYTVTATFGGEVKINGLVTADGVLWSSDEEGFYDGYGYSTNNGNTFRFSLPENATEISEPKYINDLGGKAMDYGLFDARTVDNFASNRISNYSIANMSDEDLAYVSSIEATEENPNKYQIDVDKSHWLWETVGDYQLITNPERFLIHGQKVGTIFLEIVGDDLKLSLTPPTGALASTFTATISNFGVTEIPGLQTFLENPVFPESNLDFKLLSLQKLLRSKNYTVTNSDASRVAYYTTRYAYGDCLNLDTNNELSAIYFKTATTIDNQVREPGYYKLTKAGDTFKVGTKDVDYIKVPYLENFDIWNYLTTFFTKTSENHYESTIAEVLGLNPGINLFASLFTDINIDTTTITKVELELVCEGEIATGAKAVLYNESNIIDTITFKDFGTTTYKPVDDFIQTLK